MYYHQLSVSCCESMNPANVKLRYQKAVDSLNAVVVEKQCGAAWSDKKQGYVTPIGQQMFDKINKLLMMRYRVSIEEK